MAVKKSGLGKGLDAIFIENNTQDKDSVLELRISDIEPNKNQPRVEFNEERLSELADSIAKHGILQPLLVRPLLGGGYQIVAGERRWRACRMAGLQNVPVVIRDFNDAEAMQIALIENLQREDLSPIEEAKGYKVLIEKHNFTQEEVAKAVGKSRPAITNALRLLTLPEKVMNMIESGEISAGHAKALLSLLREEDIIKVAEITAQKGLSVRELESFVKNFSSKGTKKVKMSRDSFFDEVELSLKERLGRKVKVVSGKNGKGFLEIEFYKKEDLAFIAKALGDGVEL